MCSGKFLYIKVPFPDALKSLLNFVFATSPSYNCLDNSTGMQYVTVMWSYWMSELLHGISCTHLLYLYVSKKSAIWSLRSWHSELQPFALCFALSMYAYLRLLFIYKLLAVDVFWCYHTLLHSLAAAWCYLINYTIGPSTLFTPSCMICSPLEVLLLCVYYLNFLLS